MSKTIPGKVKSYLDISEDDKIKMMKPRIEDKMDKESSAQEMENRSLNERVEILIQSVKGLENDQAEMSPDLQKADWELMERVDRLETVCDMKKANR